MTQDSLKKDKKSFEITEKEQNVLDYVKTVNNKVKSNIILLLNIYPELSTTELCEKTKKSKTTILRNIEPIIESEYITVREDANNPGKYPKKYFRLNNSRFNFKYVKGQDFRQLLLEQPELIRDYINYQKASYSNVKIIVDSACSYLDRLSEELIKTIENPQEMLELTKDNLGANLMYFLNKNQMVKLSNENYNLSNVLKDETLKSSDSPRSYAFLQLLLPIKRLIEMEISEKWIKDGSVWPFYEK